MFERTQPKVSIIIPSWFKDGQNGKYGENETFWFAHECLYRLENVTPRELYELIIIDNGSTIYNSLGFGDNPFEPETKYSEVVDGYWSSADVLVRNKENLGFGPACNQGFAIARGEYVICLNNDVLVWPGWLETMLADWEKLETYTPPIGVLMPALVKDVRDAREAIKMETIDLTSNFGQYGPGAEFGSLWLTKRSILEELKNKDGYYFDENFKLGMGEDRDLWRRIRIIGRETYRTHNTRVFHQGNMSLSKFPNRKDYTIPNREYLRKKYGEQDTN